MLRLRQGDAENKKLMLYGFVFLSVFVLSFTVGSCFMLPSGTNAVEGDLDVGIRVDSLLSMTASTENIALELTPTISGVETTGDTTITVGTNNATGYTLTMSAKTVADRDLTHSDGANKVMNSDNAVAGALGDNTWGYNVSDGMATASFLSIPSPTAPATLTATAVPNMSSDTVVTVGAKINIGIPSGTYSGVLTFTAVGNYVPEPMPAPPAGSNPSNISGTNPAVLDIYPTTGWAGDVIAITSNALFTDVENVTIGGTECSKWGVVSESLVTCRLPVRIAGTSNEVAVTNNGVNVTDASVYGHMKVTYFDPNSSTVNIGGVSYDFYPSGFASANCSAMTPSNDPINSTPAASMAYVRDVRNKQTYQVKKMADNKCWMVDNLKYIDTVMANTADDTKGMVFNGGDHLNSGTAGKYNSVNGASAQSDTNSNKAFYNNPMIDAYCYDFDGVITNTLTSCGYLYNWYAATRGTGTNAHSTSGVNVAGSICPVNFRLPSSMSDGSTIIGDGTYYTVADFAVLNASMNAGVLTTPGTATSYFAGWMPAGVWGNVFSGSWGSGLRNVGSYGYFWSSTAGNATQARILYLYDEFVGPGSYVGNKSYGYAVRCVLN